MRSIPLEGGSGYTGIVNSRFVLCSQEDDFKLKLKAQSANYSRKVNGLCAGEKPFERPMDNTLPIAVLQSSSGQNAIKVKELTALIQQLRQSVQEKELTIRKNEISSNFKVNSEWVPRLH